MALRRMRGGGGQDEGEGNKKGGKKEPMDPSSYMGALCQAPAPLPPPLSPACALARFLTPPPPPTSAVRSGPADCDLSLTRQPRTGRARSSHVLTPPTSYLQPPPPPITNPLCMYDKPGVSQQPPFDSVLDDLYASTTLAALAACAVSRDVLFQIRTPAHAAYCCAGVSQRASASRAAVECTGCVCTAWRWCGGSGAIFEMDQ